VRYVLTVVVGVGLAIALTATWLVWGPLTSGALLLMWPNRTPAVAHDLPDGYPLVHKGHMDPSTGVYVREDDDVVLTHTPPFVLRRTYLSGDRVSRQYGVGGTSNAEWYLIGDPQKLTWAELILADGGRIHFDRTSPGTSLSNAMFIHRKTPTGFWGSRLGWTGWGWVLRFQDGTLANFFACSPTGKTNCSLIRMRDSDGHILNFPRDSDGILAAIEAPTERISLEYDDRRRVVRAADAASHEVRYGYDDRGRLVQARDAEGTVRVYTYGARDEMLTIREPGWFIENTFDDDLRVIRQVDHDREPFVRPGNARHLYNRVSLLGHGRFSD
jgi:YD repeat-containing protein